MKIHEITADDGTLVPVGLEARDGALVITRGADAWTLPEGALAAVMKRYGSEVDPAAKVREVGVVRTPRGEVRHVRHLDAFDVIARDWLVFDGKAALAPTVAAALEHLAKAAQK